MCSLDVSLRGSIKCSVTDCWNFFPGEEDGPKCGVCDVHEEHDDRLRKHAAQFALLASVRSTSRFLVLFRSGALLRQRLADIFAGTLAAATQKYLVCLKRRNLRLLLGGKSDGFRPVFLRLGRRVVFLYDTNQDCLDYLLDFVVPSDELRG